ncbi:MAG: hypothetical protein L7U78_01415 [Schleiferiaceae bacterium]|nr:hypothetical protein [Schleiferiaceae bacterium]
MIKQIVFLFSLVLAVASCDRNKYAPQISLEEVGPEQVVALEDSIYMRIGFYDKDGDLGENFTDDKNLFVVDQRLNLAHEFRISNIVPGGADVPIQGFLEWTIPSVYITNGNASQKVNYSIYVVDRAGNQSNILGTPTITIIE